jgi:NAD-dependent DNA ligase
MKWRWAYPKDWDRLARECKERAGWKCEECGISHGDQVVNRRTGEVYPVRIVASHMDHDIWNPNPRLRALCPSCHARYDYSQRERARWLALERKRHQWLIRRWQERQRQ